MTDCFLGSLRGEMCFVCSFCTNGEIAGMKVDEEMKGKSNVIVLVRAASTCGWNVMDRLWTAVYSG